MLIVKREKARYSNDMEKDALRERAYEFINNNHVGVLATADQNGRPHAATIYIVADRLLNFYFVTRKETQKARNLAVNPYASIALFDAMSQTTLQADGVVSMIEDLAEGDRIFAEIQGITRRTSASGVPPVTRMAAGSYGTYKLSTPKVRLASFGDTVSNKEEVFEEIL